MIQAIRLKTMDSPRRQWSTWAGQMRPVLLLAFMTGVIAIDHAAAQPPSAGQDKVAGQEKMSAVAKQIRSRLDAQVVDWNAGDIDGFMRVYWRSPKLSFSSGGKVTRGWQKTLDGYKSRYPDAATMGKLSFSSLEVTELGDSAALVLGKWHLERKPPLESVGGNFSLVFRKMDGEWLIIHDHTSTQKKEE